MDISDEPNLIASLSHVAGLSFTEAVLECFETEPDTDGSPSDLDENLEIQKGRWWKGGAYYDTLVMTIQTKDIWILPRSYFPMLRLESR